MEIHSAVRHGCGSGAKADVDTNVPWIQRIEWQAPEVLGAFRGICILQRSTYDVRIRSPDST